MFPARGAARMIFMFLYLRVVLSRGCVWFPTRVLPVILGVLRIPPYHFACSRRWWSCCTCRGVHGRAYLSPPFAPYVSGHAGREGHVGTSRVGHVSVTPRGHTFVGVVVFLFSCSLPSVARHVTYLYLCLDGRCGGCRLCMLCMFGFLFCDCVCCASPRLFVASSVRSSFLCWFCVSPFCPFIPFCSSVAVVALLCLRRYGHACTSIPFVPYVCGAWHSHAFGDPSCWLSLPVRLSLCSSYRRDLALHGM